MVLGAVLGAVVLGAAVLRAQTPAARPGQLPVLPLTQLDERALAADLDNKGFTLTFAQPVPIRDLLLLLVRGTTLSMIPDPEITGAFIGELKNVTVRQALGLILPPVGLDYAVDGSFIRVFHRAADTRLFDLNYAATERTGSTRLGGGPDTLWSAVRISSTTNANVFAEIEKGVQSLLSEHATFNVDRKAGLLQVTDVPERLDRIATYLDAVSDRVHRQVEIDVRVLEVELKDANAQSIDLAALTAGAVSRSGAAASRQMVSGLRPGEVTRFLAALAEQGTVSALATPHILALNNEPALVRAVMTGAGPGTDNAESVTLAVTPQISSEGAIMLSLSPIVSLRAADAKDKTPAVMAVRETDTLARVADGATIVLAGFTREHETRERPAAGIKGGWFSRSTVVSKKRIELVILLTPRIVGNGEAP